MEEVKKLQEDLAKQKAIYECLELELSQTRRALCSLQEYSKENMKHFKKAADELEQCKTCYKEMRSINKKLCKDLEKKERDSSKLRMEIEDLYNELEIVCEQLQLEQEKSNQQKDINNNNSQQGTQALMQKLLGEIRTVQSEVCQSAARINQTYEDMQMAIMPTVSSDEDDECTDYAALDEFLTSDKKLPFSSDSKEYLLQKNANESSGFISLDSAQPFSCSKLLQEIWNHRDSTKPSNEPPEILHRWHRRGRRIVETSMQTEDLPDEEEFEGADDDDDQHDKAADDGPEMSFTNNKASPTPSPAPTEAKSDTTSNGRSIAGDDSTTYVPEPKPPPTIIFPEPPVMPPDMPRKEICIKGEGDIQVCPPPTPVKTPPCTPPERLQKSRGDPCTSPCFSSPCVTRVVPPCSGVSANRIPTFSLSNQNDVYHVKSSHISNDDLCQVTSGIANRNEVLRVSSSCENGKATRGRMGNQNGSYSKSNQGNNVAASGTYQSKYEFKSYSSPPKTAMFRCIEAVPPSTIPSPKVIRPQPTYGIYPPATDRKTNQTVQPCKSLKDSLSNSSEGEFGFNRRTNSQSKQNRFQATNHITETQYLELTPDVTCEEVQYSTFSIGIDGSCTRKTNKEHSCTYPLRHHHHHHHHSTSNFSGCPGMSNIPSDTKGMQNNQPSRYLVD